MQSLLAVAPLQEAPTIIHTSVLAKGNLLIYDGVNVVHIWHSCAVEIYVLTLLLHMQSCMVDWLGFDT